jgi:hypothetical protein
LSKAADNHSSIVLSIYSLCLTSLSLFVASATVQARSTDARADCETLAKSQLIFHQISNLTGGKMVPLNYKPRLVFFQYRYDEQLPEFLLMHKQEHVKCLSEHFDVIVIHADCDYREICDKYQPDLTLFESGLKDYLTCQKPQITNVRPYARIPRLGLYHADAFSHARAGFLSDMDHWGIETFFAISIAAAEHMPEIRDQIYVWPNFVDPQIFRDYGERKNIPVLFTGAKFELYPWRRKVTKLVSERYPSLTCPHPGYGGPSVPQMLVGERYARTINASWFVPACGTVAKEVVRKHFEVPACNTCLITERSPGLEAAGFIDMVNCVFADASDVLDKLEYLFQNQDIAAKIAHAGHDLVTSRHTIKHRRQIFEWFSLYKNLENDQKIIQQNPFEALAVVQKSSGLGNAHIISNAAHLALLDQGDQKLLESKYEQAEALYFKCLDYVRWMPEPRVKLAICNLYKGDAKTAHKWIAQPIEFTLLGYKAADPDPVEYAYLIITLLCLGRVNEAIMHAGQFLWLRHPELDRARWAASIWKSNGITPPFPDDSMSKRRHTIHRLPSRTFNEWILQICIMLERCGQGVLAGQLSKSLSARPRAFQESGSTRADERVSSTRGSAVDGRQASSDAVSIFRKRTCYREVCWALRKRVASILHRLELRWGYFLPFYLSESRNDEFFHAVRELMREAEIKTGLVIGASLGQYGTEAFLAGARENEFKPVVFCISEPKRRSKDPTKLYMNDTPVKQYELSASFEGASEELGRIIQEIKDHNHIVCFDAVFIDGSALKHKLGIIDSELEKELQAAKFVLFDNIVGSQWHTNYDRLNRDRQYVRMVGDLAERNGYAIFKKVLGECVAGRACCGKTLVTSCYE